MDADGVEISKPGESSHSVAAKDVSFKITTTIDTLVEAMFLLHFDGEEACISMFPRGAINTLKRLLQRVKQSKTGLLALDNYDKDMVGEELLKVKELKLWYKQIKGVSPLAGLVHLTSLCLYNNQIVDTSPLRSLPKRTRITGVDLGGCCTIL